MNRAYATLEIKAVNDTGGKRTFTGIASTPSTDRMGDIVEPQGMIIKTPTPLLWQHDSCDPIGWVTAAKVSKNGIEVQCEIATINPDSNDAGAVELAKRLSTAWQMLKSKLVRGLSIGFDPIESAQIEGTYGYRFLKTELLELSAVTIPANADCTITAIKSIDTALRAASGREQGGRYTKPGVSGKSTTYPKGRDTMKTIQELREARTTKSARCTELLELRKSDNRKFSEEEKEEFDGLTDEINDLDDEIRVMKFHSTNARDAREVKGGNAEEGSGSRGGISFVRKQDPDDKFKGQSMTRVAMAKAAAFIAMKEGNFVSPGDFAEKRWGKTHPNLVRYIKAAVAGGGTGSGEWGAEFAQSDTRYNGDFVEFLYGMTVFDRLPLREVPARVHIKGQDGAATAYWVGESKSIAVSKPDFSDVELTPLKVGAIAVCSKELVTDSDPSAEVWIRDAIAQASSQKIDTTFLGAAAAVAGVSPPGLLNGLSGIPASGVDAAAIRADIMSLYTGFLSAKFYSDIVLVMTPSTAKAISLLVNALGQTEFPNLNAKGGTLLGDPVVTGDNVTHGNVIAISPSNIWEIGDSGIQLSMSDSAMVEQNDAPQGATDTPVAASATLVSLWQEESIGFKVVRRINFAKRRSSAVAFVTNAEYGGVVS